MNELPNTLANKLSLAAFKMKKATGKQYQEMASEMDISKSQFHKMMKGEVMKPKKLIAQAVTKYFNGEITMQDMGYEK